MFIRCRTNTDTITGQYDTLTQTHTLLGHTSDKIDKVISSISDSRQQQCSHNYHII